METFVALGAITAIAIGYVLLPLGLNVFADFRKPKQVTCPDDSQLAQVTVDAAHAALTAAVGMNRLRIEGCSRWPERAACNRSCLSQLGR